VFGRLFGVSTVNTGRYLSTSYSCFFYLWFFDHNFEHGVEAAQNLPRGSIHRSKVKKYVALMSWEALLSILVPALVVPLGLDNDGVKYYGLSLSGVAGLSLCYHWLPQIYETWKLRKLGSLSFIMLILQSTGCVLTAYNLSSHVDWTGWLPLLLAAFMQYCLMFLVIYLHYVDKHSTNPTFGKPKINSDDHERLIGPTSDDYREDVFPNSLSANGSSTNGT